jgi:alkanesulfonate monooxygenase
MEVLWYLTAPDGPYPWNKKGARKIDYAYMQQLARGIDHLGYSGALLATGVHDTWVLGSSLIPFTERMRFLVAVHPGLLSPTLFAKMAATFDQFSNPIPWPPMVCICPTMSVMPTVMSTSQFGGG